MALVMIISISLLAVIFMASFVALLVVCRQKCGKVDFVAQRCEIGYTKTSKMQDVELIGAKGNLELRSHFPGDQDSPEVFLDPDWQGDAESLVSHCVALLKTCHKLTERLVVHTMERMKSQENMMEIVATAKHIGPKVDDLVQAMYTPSDSKQIEEKSSALYLAVYLLLQVIKNASEKPEKLNWADDILHSVEQRIEAMREDSRPDADYDPKLLMPSACTGGNNEPISDGKLSLCFVNRTFLA